MKSQITREEWDKYILDLFFGKNEPLENCINRAYRDFNRTLHGFLSLSKNKEITKNVKEYLIQEFEKLTSKKINTQEEFDCWHRTQCLALKKLYSKSGYKVFYIGQAQKWINMTFKYIFSYGNKYLDGYEYLYQFCHVPLDNILIKELEKKHNPPNLSTKWSRIKKYKTYFEYQDWFRSTFKNLLPLDVEFKLWLGEILDKQSTKGFLTSVLKTISKSPLLHRLRTLLSQNQSNSIFLNFKKSLTHKLFHRYL